ncbi:MAG: NAD(P)/FAD-dependent oxidoreductase [Spirochaetota bacterium]|jgi:all-trans-retinol 13,14-reductase|nr:NAD(P)/FAD-dependent oxidoreductase [Spirochaetota bacterium]
MLEYDAIVIGGGVSGLTSALLLAKRGLKTAVLETNPALMPLIRGFTRNGVHFETGFHYSFGLGEGEFGPYAFDKLGLDLQPYPLLQDGYDEIYLPTGQCIKMAYGRDRMEENLARAFPEEKEGIRLYLDRVQAEIDKSAFLNMHKGKNENAFPNILVDNTETLRSALDALIRSEKLKTIVAMHSWLYGTPPSRMSFFLHSCTVGGMYNGAYGIVGGGRAIARAYEAALEKAGVDVFLNTKAASIEEAKESGKKIITAQNHIFACDICVASIHPKSFLQIAPADVYRSGYKARLSEIEETPGFFILYGVLDEKIHLELSNILLINRYIDDMYAASEQSSSYCVSFSTASPQAVCVLAPITSDEKIWDRNAPDYYAKKNAHADSIKKDIQERLPELANHIQYLDASTPATGCRYLGYSSTYGPMHDVNKTAVLPTTKIKGLYLTGQSIVTPGLLGAIIASLFVDRLMDGR